MPGARRASLLVVVLILVLIASACAAKPPAEQKPAQPAPAAPKPPPPAAAAAKPQTPAPTAAPAKAPAADPTAMWTGPVKAAEGTFTVAVAAITRFTFDPVQESTLSYWSYMLFENLVGLHPRTGQPDPRWGLSERWDSSPDAKVWTFYLRSGAKWSDGTPVTCADVKFAIPRYWATYARTTNLGGARDIVGTAPDAISCKDDRTVVFNLAKPTFWFDVFLANMTTLGQVTPKHYVDRVGRETFAINPVTSGPYKVKSFQTGSSVTLEAVPSYWGSQPYFKEVKILVIPEESTRISMLQTGQVDAIETSSERTPSMRKLNMTPVQYSDLIYEWRFFEFWRDKVAADRDVRRAILLAIDKQGLCKAFFQGECRFKGGALYRMDSLYDERRFKVPDSAPYDPKTAAEIVKQKVPPSWELQISAFNRTVTTVAHSEAIAAMLQAVGFKTKILVTDYATARDKWMDGKFDRPTVWVTTVAVEPFYLPDIMWTAPEEGGRWMQVLKPEPWQADFKTKSEQIGGLYKAKNAQEYLERYYKLAMEDTELLTGPQNLFLIPAYNWANPKTLPPWGWYVSGWKQNMWLPGVTTYPLPLK